MFRRKSKLDKLAEHQEAIGQQDYIGGSGLVADLIRDRSFRETVESILIAVVLALLFRNFLGEAYIIPTGSMASTLQGSHIDVQCPQCEYQYRTGASEENDGLGIVKATVCPLCRYELRLERDKYRDHRSFAGDRILVNKFIYDFQTPGRWDVIVFKYPNIGKQNYIKRCVGLPGEGVLIEHGDIFTYDLDRETFADRAIARKDPTKLAAMLQLVDDTHHFAEALQKIGWPSRWQQRAGVASADSAWQVNYSGHTQSFSVPGTASETQWLSYRHAMPRPDDWTGIKLGKLPQRFRTGGSYRGELITDHYAYNESESTMSYDIGRIGFHWVGDIGCDADVTIESDRGELIFRLVEGGVVWLCTIDVATGMAELSFADDSAGDFISGDEPVTSPPRAATRLKGPGSHRVRFVNADDRLYLYVDGKPVEFPASTYRLHVDNSLPKWTESDPGDAEPLAIGSRGVGMTINRLKVLRDIYYTSSNQYGSTRNQIPELQIEYTIPVVPNGGSGRFQRNMYERIRSSHQARILDVLRTPEKWGSEFGVELFRSRDRSEDWVFELLKLPEDPDRDQFLPLGDNSPQSSDARCWGGVGPHVDRSFLLGRAMFVYWPHAKTKPLPFTPNFERMKLIR